MGIKQQKSFEQIELLRGGAVVSTLLGAFGGSIRETRITALLGFLIALNPNPFLEFFGFKGKALSVRLENMESDGRSDIRIETSEGIGIVEAKVGASDPLEQSKKYNADWKVLLTQRVSSASIKGARNTNYLNWQKIASLLDTLSRSRNSKVKFISQDLYNYLEEFHMVKRRESVEIYAREINEEITLAFFLKAQMYGCKYEAGSRLPEALYFAPHFGQAISDAHPGVHIGISYIARIERVEVIETWKELMDTIIIVRGKHWMKSHFSEIKPLKTEWDWSKRKKRSFLFLATPRLAFNPPVKKEFLQKGKGWLSKRFLSFDELFYAWGC